MLKSKELLCQFIAFILLQNSAQGATLSEALASSYKTNPQMQSAIQALSAVDEEMPSAISGALPTASATIQRGKKHSELSGTEVNGISDAKVIEINQPLFKGGHTYASIKKANNNILAARENFKITEQLVLLSAVTSYMDVVRDREVFELATHNKSVFEHHLESSNARFELGELTQTDVAQAKAALAKANSELISAQSAFESSKAGYKNNIGEEPLEVKIPQNPIKINGNIDELIKIALENNPSIKAAGYGWDAAKNDINIKKSALLPELSAFANSQKQEDASLTSNRSDSSMVGLNLSIPLYQGGAEYSDVRKAKHLAGKSSYDFSVAQNNVREEVIRAYQNFKVAQSLIESNTANVEAREVALEGTQQEALEGLRTTIDVLDAQQALFDAKSNLISAQRDEIVNSYALLAQLGRLTAADLGLKVDIYNPTKNTNKSKYHIIGF